MATQTRTSLGSLSPFTAAIAGATIPRLSREQLDVITETDTHLVVEAGAGSGKTATLIEKMLYEVGCSPLIPQRVMRSLAITEIGAITFTTKAAGELTSRLQEELLRRADVADGNERQRIAMLGHEVGEARIGTIDAFAVRLLNEYGSYGGYSPFFDIVEHPRVLYASVAEDCLAHSLRQQDPGAVLLARHFGPHAAREFLSNAFGRGDLLCDLGERLAAGTLTWDAVPGLELTAVDRILEPRSRDVLAFTLDAYRVLEQRMMELGAYDHTQIMIRAAKLAEHPYVQTQVRSALKLLIVDEHQDTNLTQCRLLFRLTGLLQRSQDLAADVDEQPVAERPELRLVLVGDPKQSIYGFRGADVTLWDVSSRLVRSRGGKCLRLRDNYRTRPTLVRFFDATLGGIMLAGTGGSSGDVPYRPLMPKRPETPGRGVEILLASHPGPQYVAEVVADRVAEMLRRPHEHTVCDRLQGGGEFPRALRPSDVAVLARTMRGAAEHYERAFRERGIPYRVLGGQGLFARPEVQNLVILVRALADPTNSRALVAYLRSPLGDVDDAIIAELAAASGAGDAHLPRRPIYNALEQAGEIVSEPVRAARAERALGLLAQLRPVVDRIPHPVLLEEAIKRADYEMFLAGAPDPVSAIQNVRRFVRWLGDRSFTPLRQLAEELAGRVAGAEYDEEASAEPEGTGVVTISSVHRAKGLEWPVVVLTGLDQGVARRVRPDRPQLDRELGVVLPLQVTVNGAKDTESIAVDPSAAWERHSRTMLRRDYAEAKRIFYVGCTRARDRLILAGALTHGSRPKALDPDPEWMHADGVERWLRYLYPELTRADRHRSRVSYATAPGLSARRVAYDLIDVRRY